MNDLYKDILKARQIPAPSETNVNFKRTKAKERRAHDKKTNLPNIRQPKNAQLYYDMLENAGVQSDYAKRSPDTEINFDENLVSCSIQAVCGRMYHSEESIKMFVTSLQNKKDSSEAGSSKSEEGKNVSLGKKNESKEKNNEPKGETEIVNEEEILKRSGLIRNGVIKGLLKKKLISVHDIRVPDIKPRQTQSDKENLYTYPSFVPNPEEPDVYVRPPQAYNNLHETYKDIDFTVTHVGKKQVTTSRQFYLDVDDDYFTFIKRKAN